MQDPDGADETPTGLDVGQTLGHVDLRPEPARFRGETAFDGIPQAKPVRIPDFGGEFSCVRGLLGEPAVESGRERFGKKILGDGLLHAGVLFRIEEFADALGFFQPAGVLALGGRRAEHGAEIVEHFAHGVLRTLRSKRADVGRKHPERNAIRKCSKTRAELRDNAFRCRGRIRRQAEERRDVLGE